MTGISKERAIERTSYLAGEGWGDANVFPLTPDASFRSYARLERGEEKRMLMDAPPSHENLRAYLDVTSHLRSLGLRVADTFGVDEPNGFAMIEDMGDDTFTRLLNAGHDELSLYLLAVDVLKKLHTHDRALDLDLPPYDMVALLREVELFVDWFVPACRGSNVTPTEKQAYMDAWEKALERISLTRDALVLRDYHVDNLMITGSLGGVESCGLLDYQDALIGSRAYDLVSLVEDARRDVSPHVYEACVTRYSEGLSLQDQEKLRLDMALLGAQRHAKVAGIFIRLSKRDAKPIYLKHMPRVLRLMKKCLENDALQDVRATIDRMVPGYEEAIF
ncbi:MAG: phosphotransferase [Alphaproteobacteria bacterium]|nr:phosphotransferase [Alphaproteobacteria bacterium]